MLLMIPGTPKTITDNLPDTFTTTELVVFDGRGDVVFANDLFLARAVAGPADANALNINDVFPGGNATHIADMWATISQGASWKGIVEDRDIDGYIYDRQLSVMPLYGGNEHNKRYALTSEVICSRPAGLTNDHETLFDNIPFPVWIYDVETLRFLDINEAACVDYNYSRAEYDRMLMTDIIEPDDIGRLAAITSDDANDLVVKLKKKNGGQVITKIGTTIISFRNRTASVVIGTDSRRS